MNNATDNAANTPPWPGDKLKKCVETEAKRLNREVEWVTEVVKFDGVIVRERRWWNFVKPIPPPKLPKLLKSERPFCGARCRDGHSCRARVVEDRRRCRMHGGLSTGPRSEAGRERIRESNRRRAKLKQV
ncbi:MAG: hypothetical protein JO316_15660 [Abitibacteriaceae bacterium]|nr:hypothetical protein [Abditibacteriaceae bacterium]MBV9866791.1 hypothetical protein [Abditibacteriaceae bacterium]